MIASNKWKDERAIVTFVNTCTVGWNRMMSDAITRSASYIIIVKRNVIEQTD